MAAPQCCLTMQHGCLIWNGSIDCSLTVISMGISSMVTSFKSACYAASLQHEFNSNVSCGQAVWMFR